jgi:hypothetical protein
MHVFAVFRGGLHLPHVFFGNVSRANWRAATFQGRGTAEWIIRRLKPLARDTRARNPIKLMNQREERRKARQPVSSEGIAELA